MDQKTEKVQSLNESPQLSSRLVIIIIEEKTEKAVRLKPDLGSNVLPISNCFYWGKNENSHSGIPSPH